MAFKPINVFHEQDFDEILNFIVDSKSYRRSSLEESDVIIHTELCQGKIKIKKLMEELSSRYASSHKKVILFILDDFEKKLVFYPNLIIVRTSARASRLSANEIVLPYVWEYKDQAFAVSESTTLPKVGFCGLVSKSRKKITRVFGKSKEVTSDFIIRDKFWGGSPLDPTIQTDFFKNIENNQFILSNRGAGNFSMRFYQVLSCGRIPVLVNTDMQLPFSNKIDWKKIVVFEKNEKLCLQRVVAIHREDNYKAMQIQCRAIFDDFFSQSMYFDRLVEDIREKSLLESDISIISNERSFLNKAIHFLKFK